MTMRGSAPITTERLAAYAEGAVADEERAELEDALARDEALRNRLAQVRELHVALAAPVPELEALDMQRRVRVALQARAGRHRRWYVAVMGWAAAAAAVCCLGYFGFGYLGLQRAGDTEAFGARGQDPEPTRAAARWAGFRAYRARSELELLPLDAGAVISNADRLLFTYTNLGPSPFTHLMIFATDTRGEVYWYYPPHEVAGADPSSIAIEPRAGEILPDLISHDYAVGPLSLHALFSRRPMRVSEVEDGLRKSPAYLEQLPDVFAQKLSVQVKP